MGTEHHSTFRCARPVLALGATVLLLLAACGDDSDDADTSTDEASDSGSDDGPDPFGEAFDELLDDDALAEDCPLDADQVSEAVDRDVTFEGVGFRSRMRVDGLSLDINSAEPDEIEDSAGAGYVLAWAACTYATDDDTEYEVGLLGEEEGRTPAESFDNLLAEAAGEDGNDEDADTGPPAVGDEAFFTGGSRSFTDEEIVVLAGERTLTISLRNNTPTGESAADTRAGLTAMAEAAVDAGLADETVACPAALGAAPAEWGEISDPLYGGGGGATTDGEEYSHTSCSAYSGEGISDSDSDVELRLGDADFFRILAESESDEGAGAPETVEGIGDAAVTSDGVLFVRVGSEVAVVSVTTADDRPTDPDELDALAGAVVNTLR